MMLFLAFTVQRSYGQNKDLFERKSRNTKVDIV